MTRIKWFPPEQEPNVDALVVSASGNFIWHSWDGAAPGWWKRLVKLRGIKKWRKIMHKKHLQSHKN